MNPEEMLYKLLNDTEGRADLLHIVEHAINVAKKPPRDEGGNVRDDYMSHLEQVAMRILNKE